MLAASLRGEPMAARIFLGLSALIWLPYGLLCFFQPAGLAESAGVTFTNATGATELRAMYGGLQAAIGAGLDGGLSSYTGMALVLELGTVAFTAWLLRRVPALAA
jgi:hypothetical protein